MLKVTQRVRTTARVRLQGPAFLITKHSTPKLKAPSVHLVAWCSVPLVLAILTKDRLQNSTQYDHLSTEIYAFAYLCAYMHTCVYLCTKMKTIYI